MKPESKAKQKAREIAERKAAKEAAELAERNRVFATPIAHAVAPLKIQAVAAAEVRAKEWAEARLAELAAAGWDINKIAPAPQSWGMGREEYQAKSNRRKMYECITSFESKTYNDQSFHKMDLPRIVKKDQKKIDRHIEISRDIAAGQYESFVYKMVGKVGDHTAAELEKDMGGLWGYSHLLVTKADGTIERWKTQIIVNVSVYGKLFNQWPSRIVK